VEVKLPSIRITAGLALLVTLLLVLSSEAAAAKRPRAPSGLTATAVSSSEIDLHWTNNATTSVTAITVERALSPGGPWSVIATLASSATSYPSTA